jgi:hypothetical protein
VKSATRVTICPSERWSAPNHPEVTQVINIKVVESFFFFFICKSIFIDATALCHAFFFLDKINAIRVHIYIKENQEKKKYIFVNK